MSTDNPIKTKQKKGLFGGFFKNVLDTDKDDDGVKDSTIIKNAMGLFNTRDTQNASEDSSNTKAFLGLESAKKNEKKTTTIIMIAVAVVVLLFLFMKKK